MSFLQNFNFTTFPNIIGGGTSPFSQSTPFGSTNRFSTSTSSLGNLNLNNLSPAHIQQNIQQYQNIPIPQSIQPQQPLQQSNVINSAQQQQRSNLDYFGNPIISLQQQQPQQKIQSRQFRTQTQQQQTQQITTQFRHQLTPSSTSNLNSHDEYSNTIPNNNNNNLNTYDAYDYEDNSNYNQPLSSSSSFQQPQQPQQQQPQHIPQAPIQTQRRRKSKKVSQRNIVHYPSDLRVTPIQGPIYAKDGLVPVVPLYSYSAVSNGTFYQIPILWTALSVALGLEVRGEILRGLPCIKRLNQLFCPTAGNTYPLDSIERFIDENKALIKRMYGEFVMLGSESYGPVGGTVGNILRRSAREVYGNEVPDYFSNGKHQAPVDNFTNGNSTHGEKEHKRTARQTVNPRTGGPTEQPKSNRVDSCESKVEVTTPYWAANSAGKVRAIVNTQHFEQAIHQEVCAKTTTTRCAGDCGCEQKYKWHRLLAYDPDNDCKGIFMDWFLFPSCCVCRCDP